MFLLPLLVAAVHARCALSQTQTDDGVFVRVEALALPITCRTVTLSSDEPLTLHALRVDADTRVHRLRGDHLRALPGGGWEIGAPELGVGDRLEITATVPGRKVSIALGPAEPTPPPTSLDESRTVLLDARHPA